MKKNFTILAILLLTLTIAISPINQTHQTVLAASSSKAFATNFTLVNLGDALATVNAAYLTPEGGTWGDSIFKTFSIAPGANAIARQYFDTGLTPGRGSVVVSSDQRLGALVQEIVRTGVPSSGAYTGIDTASTTWFIPQLARRANTATGLANSQIIVQNASSTTIGFNVDYYTRGVSSSAFNRSYSNLAPGASIVIDLDEEAGLPTSWWGSAIVSTTSGGLGVLSHLFMGADSLMAFNAFPAEMVTDGWKIPLLYSRLTNTLNTSLAIQNLSDTTIPKNDLTLTCIRDVNTVGPDTLSLKNTADIPKYSTFAFNTLTDTSNFPANWQGSCDLTSATGKDTAVLIMYRWVKNAEQAAYSAVPNNLSSKKVTVPLVAKRLSNGYANTVTIQNMDNATATLTIRYIPSGGGTPIVRPSITIDPNASRIFNFRLSGTEAAYIPDGWEGSMVIESNTNIAAYVSNTYLNPTGDQFMAYLGFNQ